MSPRKKKAGQASISCMWKKICLFIMVLTILVCPMSVSAEEIRDIEDESQLPETISGQETDQESEQESEQGTEQESGAEVPNGILSVEVKYTGDLVPHKGDRFRIAYQVIGSEEPATITLDAEEINGYVGEITMGAGSYEIMELEYIGDNSAIETYAIESNFMVTEGGGDTICLVIGPKAFDLSGQDGYCVRVGEKDLEEDIPSDEADDEEQMEEEDSKETTEQKQTKRSGPLKFICLLLMGVLLVIAVFFLKKSDLIQD